MHRKLAVLILYSVLLLASGYLLGRSAATTAAPPAEIRSVHETAPANTAATSVSEFTDWPNLTP